MLLMKLKSFKYLFGFLILIIFTQLKSEEKIDIWKKKDDEKKEVSIEKKEVKFLDAYIADFNISD